MLLLFVVDACQRSFREHGKAAAQVKGVTSLTGYGRSLPVSSGYCGVAASHCRAAGGEYYLDDEDDLMVVRTPMSVLPAYCTGIDYHLQVQLLATIQALFNS